MKTHDDEQRHRHRDAVCDRRGDRAVERRLDRVRDRGLRDDPERHGAHGDAQLRCGEHQRHVLHGPQHRVCRARARLGERLDRAAASGDDRKLRANEERVCQQQAGHAKNETDVHGATSRGVVTARKRSMRRPSMRSTVSVTLVELDHVSVLGKPAERRHDKSADGLVDVGRGKRDPRALRHLVRAQHRRNDPRASRRLEYLGPARVVLVRDLANDLFYDVLEGDDSRRASVLVDHDRALQSKVLELHQERTQRHRLRNAGRCDHEFPRRRRFAFVRAHGDRLSHVHEADDVVDAVAHHRKTRVTGPAGERKNIGRRRIRAHGVHARAVGHDIDRLEVIEIEGVLEKQRRSGRERPHLGGTPHERRELLTRAPARELLLRLEPHKSSGPRSPHR